MNRFAACRRVEDKEDKEERAVMEGERADSKSGTRGCSARLPSCRYLDKSGARSFRT